MLTSIFKPHADQLNMKPFLLDPARIPTSNKRLEIASSTTQARRRNLIHQRWLTFDPHGPEECCAETNVHSPHFHEVCWYVYGPTFISVCRSERMVDQCMFVGRADARICGDMSWHVEPRVKLFVESSDSCVPGPVKPSYQPSAKFKIVYRLPLQDEPE